MTFILTTCFFANKEDLDRLIFNLIEEISAIPSDQEWHILIILMIENVKLHIVTDIKKKWTTKDVYVTKSS